MNISLKEGLVWYTPSTNASLFLSRNQGNARAARKANRGDLQARAKGASCCASRGEDSLEKARHV